MSSTPSQPADTTPLSHVDTALAPEPVSVAPAAVVPALATAPEAPAALDAAAAVPTEPPALDAPADAAAPEAASAPAPGMTPADCARELQKLFPALFDGPPKPLKLRVQADIQARTEQRFSKKLLSAVLSRHTGTTAYLRALVRATHRVDLDGQPTDPVSDEHRQIAQQELDRRQALMAERRAQERAQQRTSAGASASGEAAPAGGQPRPDRRPPRGPRPAPAQGERAARPQDGAPSGDRPPRGERSDSRRRPERAERSDRPARAERAPGSEAAPRTPNNRPQGRPQGDRPQAPRTEQRAPRAAAPGPQAVESDDPVKRQRATLLRDFERTTLTAANFCALKGLSVAQLDEQLALARQEAAQAPRAPRDGARHAEAPRSERGERRGERRGPRPERTSPPSGDAA